MRLANVDVALEACAAHLSSVEDLDPSVESLLTQSVLILICAEFEKKFRELILRRCSAVSDAPVKSYLASYTETVLRSLRLDDVRGLLSRFGEAHKAAFAERLVAEDGVVEMYSSIVVSRNAVAHGGASQATLREVRQFYEAGHAVLDYFDAALWLGSPPLGDGTEPAA